MQPSVDKMIPIYFDDPNLGPEDIDRVSQMFVTDRSGKTRGAEDALSINRTDITIQCSSSLPFIALLLDFDAEANFTASWEPNHPGPDPCLRIYASGLNDNTFPFLREHPELVTRLQDLLPKEMSSIINQCFKFQWSTSG